MITFLALTAAFTLQTPTAAPDFSTPPVVAETTRLRLTPKLDGVLSEEEWDSFGGDATSKTYLQWEPGTIYAAVTAPGGKDLLLSLDLKNNGWLVGRDNLEVRLSTQEGRVKLTARLLDATNVTGPVWRDLPGFVLSSRASAVTAGETVTYELALTDPGIGLLPTDNAKIGARLDVADHVDAAMPTLQVRSLSVLSMATARAAALPAAIKWGVERNDRPAMPGENATVRFTFLAKPTTSLKRVELRSEGFAKDATDSLSKSFPTFDRRGRAYVDLATKIAPGATLGYRLARATVTGDDGVPAVVQASYRIAPALDIDMVQEVLPISAKDRNVRIVFYLRPYSDKRMAGSMTIKPPTGFKIVNGGESQAFKLFEPRLPLRQAFELFVPMNSIGTFPVQFDLNIEGRKSTATSYITIGG